MKKLFFVLLVCSIAAIAQQQPSLKIGYVNSETIIKELPEAKDSQAKLEAILKGWQDEIEKRGQALQSKYEEYQKQANMLNESTKQAKQKELVDDEQKLNQYRQEKQQELAVQRDKIMKPIQEKVFKAIEKVAKEQKLSFVLDRATEVPVLYADPQYDYTYKVLDMLKRGAK
ncbi:MAG: OmpH family outer membrane protein [Bacteroidota bacterium]